MNYFHQLSPAELERLVLLSEECAEVIQIVSKIQRHGYESKDPTLQRSRTNRAQLCKELGDVQFALDLMIKSDDLNPALIRFHREIKQSSVWKYLHHNEEKDYRNAIMDTDI